MWIIKSAVVRREGEGNGNLGEQYWVIFWALSMSLIDPRI